MPLPPLLLVSHIDLPPQCPFVAFHSCWTCFLRTRLFLKAYSQPRSDLWSCSKSFLPSQSQRDFSPLLFFFFLPQGKYSQITLYHKQLAESNALSERIDVYLCMLAQYLVSVFFFLFFFLFAYQVVFVVRSALRRTDSTSELNKISLMLGLRSDLKLLSWSVYLALLCGNCCYGYLVFATRFTWWQCFFLFLIKEWM